MPCLCWPAFDPTRRAGGEKGERGLTRGWAANTYITMQPDIEPNTQETCLWWPHNSKGAEDRPGRRIDQKTRGLTPKEERRFWARVEKGGPAECWNWTGGKNIDGHGWFMIEHGRCMHVRAGLQVRRVAWALVNGTIPDKTKVFNRCGNPLCVNPEHQTLAGSRHSVIPILTDPFPLTAAPDA